MTVMLISSCEKLEVSKRPLTTAEMMTLFKEAARKMEALKEEKRARYMSADKSMRNPPPDFEITEGEALEILEPIINEAPSYLYSTYGISMTEFTTIPDDPNIALISMIAVRNDQLHQAGLTIDTNSVTYNYLHPLNSSMSSSPGERQMIMPRQIFDCLMEATGLDVAISMMQDGITLPMLIDTRSKALRKLASKVAIRGAGPIGVAIAIYEFTSCMADYES